MPEESMNLAAEIASGVPDGASTSTPPTEAISSPAPSPVPDPNPSPAPAPAPAPTTTPPVAASPAPGQPAAPVPGQAPTYANFREMAAAQGLAFASQFQDDTQFAAGLFTGIQGLQRNLQQLQQQNQQLQMMAARAMQQPAAPQNPAAPQDPLAAYRSPEWRPEWNEGLTFDPQTGALTGVKPGVDPALALKYTAHQQHRRNMADQMLNDLPGFLRPLIRAEAASLARQQVQQTLQVRDQTQFANDYIAQNARWMFECDAQGRPIPNPLTGRNSFTTNGQMFYHFLGQAQAKGWDQRDQVEYAQAMLERHLVQPILQQQWAQAQDARQRAAIQNQPVPQMRPSAQPDGAFVPNPLPHTPQPAAQNQHQSLKSMIEQSLHGVAVS